MRPTLKRNEEPEGKANYGTFGPPDRQMQTLDGRVVDIETRDKSGMSIFKVFGFLSGKPCHWTADGKFRMDGKSDPRDIAQFDVPDGFLNAD